MHTPGTAVLCQICWLAESLRVGGYSLEHGEISLAQRPSVLQFGAVTRGEESSRISSDVVAQQGHYMSGKLMGHEVSEAERPFFEGMDEASLREAIPSSFVRPLPARTVVVHAQDVSDAFYVILSGRVKVFGMNEEGKEFIFCTLQAGEYFGEMALYGGSRSASVMTLEHCRLLVIPGRHIDELTSRYPAFTDNLTFKLIRKVRSLTHMTMSLAYEDIYSRFVEYTKEVSVVDEGRCCIPGKPTQSEIAARIGGSREMVSRIITDLCAGGYISLIGRHIEIHKKLPAKW